LQKTAVLSAAAGRPQTLNNQNAVRSEKIRLLYHRAKKEAKKFKDLHFCWVPREQNKEADALTRKAYQDSIESSRLKKHIPLSGKSNSWTKVRILCLPRGQKKNTLLI
jgi:ribonuclease HI